MKRLLTTYEPCPKPLRRGKLRLLTALVWLGVAASGFMILNILLTLMA